MQKCVQFVIFSLVLLSRNTGGVTWATTQKRSSKEKKKNEVTPQAHSRSLIGFYIQWRYFYLSEQHGLWIDCILTEALTMRKMIPADLVLTLPNIPGHMQMHVY